MTFHAGNNGLLADNEATSTSHTPKKVNKGIRYMPMVVLFCLFLHTQQTQDRNVSVNHCLALLKSKGKDTHHNYTQLMCQGMRRGVILLRYPPEKQKGQM